MSDPPQAPEVFVGIDIAKDTLAVHVRPAGAALSFPNDPDGTDALARHLAGLGPAVVVMEATGGYERPAAAALASRGLPVAVVNPLQARRFAEATGRLAKTDPIDAAVLAHFAQAVRPEPRPLPDAGARLLADLLARRRQLLGMLNAELQRLDSATVKALRRDISDHVKFLRRRLDKAEAELDRAVKSSPAWREKEDLLRSVPGVGPQVSKVLLAELPELGSLTGRRLAALTGLAPYSRDSGRHAGRRRCSGGRRRVRCALYQAALVAARFNAPLARFYGSLLGRGKPKKLALIALARRLLNILNAVLRDRRRWDEILACPT